MFDETYIHSARNETQGNRIILFCDVERPLYTAPARAFNRFVARNLIAAGASPNQEGDRTGGFNRLFKYFYVLRPLLAARWVEQERGPVPMLFATLLETIRGQTGLSEAITALLAQKLSGEELGEGPRVPALHEFIEAELRRLDSVAGSQPKVRGEAEPLNELFREYLGRAWESVPGRID